MARFTSSVEQITDINGVPIVGAKKFFFEPGTTIQKDIYTDSGLTVVGANPQLSDADGRYTGDIFLDGLYKEEQQDNSGTTSGYDGVTLWTSDPIGDVVLGSHSLWVSSDSYNIPEIVLGSDDFYYESLTDANQGNNPISSPANWAKITFVKAGVASGVTSIEDTNGLTAIEIAATSSAVNHPKIINAAAGEDPRIEPAGTDANTNLELAGKGTGGIELIDPIVDDAQNEIIKVASTASAVNELTATNAATGNGPTLSATGDDTDIPLNLAGKGIGGVHVRATPIYGMVLLDTPVVLATDTSTTATGNTPVDITAQTTGIAVKAILNVHVDVGTTVITAGDTEILVAHGDETLTTVVHRAVRLGYTLSGIDWHASNQLTVNLADGEIFDYSIVQGGTAPNTRTVTIYLAGYYV